MHSQDEQQYVLDVDVENSSHSFHFFNPTPNNQAFCRKIDTSISVANMVMPPTSNHYQTLGVAGDSTETEILSAFRKLQRKYHPDRQPANTDLGASNLYSSHLNHAKDELLSETQRPRLDALLKANKQLPHFSEPHGIPMTTPFIKPKSWNPAPKPKPTPKKDNASAGSSTQSPNNGNHSYKHSRKTSYSDYKQGNETSDEGTPSKKQKTKWDEWRSKFGQEDWRRKFDQEDFVEVSDDDEDVDYQAQDSEEEDSDYQDQEMDD
ncbi:uncharacterized protein EAF02_004329 [Botrytis sinoallii]|uniref:uncharacterized protein n=1 Tax=Botrytis sinoallii TaxID=1463999 RepID=UPI0019005676|nr:uncharacterized protein EAF02_004329 [Botrytis sinoallii]KAF7885820.1 hypothetical protein EAF02_004329 [Botrytis sinoallii]